MQRYKDIIELLSMAPDSQFDKNGAAMCKDWDGQDAVRFLRDVLDLSVRYAWGSRFIIILLERSLEGTEPETEEEAELRRAALLAKWEPEYEALALETS